MSQTYTVTCDSVIPEWLQEADLQGLQIQVNTAIGWIDIDGDAEYRNGLTYRVKA